MRNAVLAVLSWAGQEEGAKAVVVKVETSNEGSRRVVESIPGFVREEDEDVDWKGTPKVVRVWRLRFE
jgi:RimJ/RimL family protein N-acetyltransferase